MLNAVLLILATFGQDVPRPVPHAPTVITFPKIVKPVTPPTPIPAGTVPVLDADVVYAIEASADCIVLSSPDGLVDIKAIKGPAMIKGKWWDDPTGKPTWRTIKGPFIWTVDAVDKGRCEILVYPIGVKVAKDVGRQLLDVLGPRPPPDPDPEPDPPKPPTPVDPSPFPDAGFRCLIVYETKDLAKLPTVQEQIIYSKTVRDYLNAKAVAGSDGKTKEWRIYDKDVDLSADSKVWQDAMKRPRQSVPWVLIGDGKTGYEGPLPADVPAMLTLLRKYGGA